MSPPLRAETVGAREEVRLEDRLHTSFRDAWTTRSAIVAIPRRRSFPPVLGIIRSRTGSGRKLRSSPQSAARRGILDSAPPRWTPPSRGPPRRSWRPCCPAPDPRHQEKRRIGDEVEQVVEHAMDRHGPSGAAWSGFPVPEALPVEAASSSSVFTSDPPGIPVSSLPSCWPPSPCVRFSRTPPAGRHARDYYEASAPSPATGRQRTCPVPARPHGRQGGRGWFPRSPSNRSAS